MAETPKIRTPIVCVMGHVDHGKTSLLDRIRGSSVVSSEAGAITQHIGATIVPIDAIRKLSGSMEKIPINIPGLLFIDTPGHHAFTTLRARGGALADMAILVVDISQGFQPQTIEALQILRNCRTPFVIAATKIDRIHGWRVNENEPFLSTFAKQNERVKGEVETKTARTLVLEPGAYPPALVLANFKDKDVDTLLDLMKQAQVNIPLKAVVTPANRSWVFGDLLAHLQEEHTAFTAAKENQTR